MKRFRPLITAMAAAVLLRLPLWLLPGPGRDEAAYAYWAWHPQPFYAPLLQILLRLAERLPLAPLLQLRLPSLVGGFAVLWLVDLRLRRQQADRATHWLVLLAVALCPWQTYTGAILHPDTLLLAALLGAVVAAQRGLALTFSAAMALAALAKPTGILLLPVAVLLVGRIDPGRSRGRAALGRIVLALTLLPLALHLKGPMLRAMAEFGRVDVATGWSWRILAGLTTVVVTGGPLLWVLAGAGLRQRMSSFGGKDGPGREALVSLGLAATLLLVFSAAAVVRGQIKANWVLPAAVLLLPARRPAFVDPLRREGRGLAAILLGLSLLLGGATALVFHDPRTIAPGERLARSLHLDYLRVAGRRELRVSPTHRWHEYFGEWRDLGPFVGDLQAAWETLEGPAPIDWIVSDDYGLASQVAWYQRHHRPRTGHRAGPTLVLIGDGLYHQSAEALQSAGAPGPLLLLAVQVPVDSLGRSVRRVTPLRTLRHPLTAGVVEVAGGLRTVQLSASTP